MNTLFSAKSAHPWPAGNPALAADARAEWLITYLRRAGWEPVADESHVWLATRRPLSPYAAAMLHELREAIHALLLAEQGRPISEAETLADLA